MINKQITLPFSIKTSILLIGIFTFISILYIVQDIIIPLVFAGIIAILINPIVNFFIRRKIHRLIAIFFTLLLITIFIGAVGLLLVWQISGFTESWPSFVDKLTTSANQSIISISKYIDIDKQYIYDWITKIRKQLIDNNGLFIGQKIMSLGSGLMSMVLIPIYIFFILYYKSHLFEFVCKLFPANYKVRVTEVISEIKIVVQRYLSGLIIELIIVAVLNSTGLLIIGIDYAILLGVLGALLNLIPYIGGMVAVTLPMIIALATKTTAWYAFYVLALYTFVQFLDNYILVPNIVASKVKINALFSIIVVLAGNALWGVSGMFLSIPLLAIIKLIFDHIEPLKPWGFLFGDTTSNLLKLKPIKK
ncbi:MAG: AI-2E family transporter [Bacteroidales bacterium]|nr:AI-2E family transporter [Bacteroidales bacterium]MDD4002133.1 AI-2E family transporter [Bacteroidales bacterium]MDD4828907.1 AI-2E family transporter [Bacteroidales bacterium]